MHVVCCMHSLNQWTDAVNSAIAFLYKIYMNYDTNILILFLKNIRVKNHINFDICILGVIQGKK